MNTNDDKNKQIEDLAREIFKQVQAVLELRLRFLNFAICKLNLVAKDIDNYATDGSTVFFSPYHVLKTYKKYPTEVTRDYLHVIFHCVYCHFYASPTINVPIWNLACDIAVEWVLNSLNISDIYAPRVEKQNEYFESLKDDVDIITAEKMYRYLVNKSLTEGEIDELCDTFSVDNHVLWFPNCGIIAVGLQSDLQEWENYANQVIEGISLFGIMQGDLAGALVSNFRDFDRKNDVYASFLRRFVSSGECMKINDDEFDMSFYIYGLQLYKNMPLIEPLEYKTVKKIKEVAIAIDTSGSTAIGLVQQFLQTTYDILKNEESFFTKFNVHVIQCDATIQSDTKITSKEELERYIDDVEIRGMGGTDFRPVFKYVDKLIKKGEFDDFKGLIYFTDGYGTFPEKKPEFETAFVLMDSFENAERLFVPPWAIKLVLRSNEIKEI